jgi:hypothetical protein
MSELKQKKRWKKGEYTYGYELYLTWKEGKPGWSVVLFNDKNGTIEGKTYKTETEARYHIGVFREKYGSPR